jgi:hypothetical protein
VDHKKVRPVFLDPVSGEPAPCILSHFLGHLQRVRFPEEEEKEVCKIGALSSHLCSFSAALKISFVQKQKEKKKRLSSAKIFTYHI